MNCTFSTPDVALPGCSSDVPSSTLVAVPTDEVEALAYTGGGADLTLAIATLFLVLGLGLWALADFFRGDDD